MTGCFVLLSMFTKHAFFYVVAFHGYVPRTAKWGNGRDCVQSFGKTEDDAKVLAHQIAGHTHTNSGVTRRRVSTKTIAKLDVSVVKATEIRRTQHPELVALIIVVAGATELLKLAANRLNEVRAQVALWRMSVRAQH